jgi:hypothetical protein
MIIDSPPAVQATSIPPWQRSSSSSSSRAPFRPGPRAGRAWLGERREEVLWLLVFYLDDDRFAEYYLLGTFLSLSLALAGGLLLSRILGGSVVTALD